MEIGYTMMTEQTGPRELVRDVVRAEQVGFDFSVSSDHYFPWLDSQGHASHAWTVLGAAAQATQRIPLMTSVTCPIVRYHPAIVAQMAATKQILSEGRFTLGLGAGENLNEHVGGGWPPVNISTRCSSSRCTSSGSCSAVATSPSEVTLRRRVGQDLGPARGAADRPGCVRARRRLPIC